jgi:hypothetical protein
MAVHDAVHFVGVFDRVWLVGIVVAQGGQPQQLAGGLAAAVPTTERALAPGLVVREAQVGTSVPWAGGGSGEGDPENLPARHRLPGATPPLRDGQAN